MKNRKLTGRVRRMASRGVTLIEIMIVLAIIAVMAGVVVGGIMPQFAKAKVKTAGEACGQLRGKVQQYQVDHQGGCATLQQMKDSKDIDKTFSDNDPWGHPYEITCDNDEVYVSSWGPDGKSGTADDINIPGKKE
jgi:general secretion pathway protein G